MSQDAHAWPAVMMPAGHAGDFYALPLHALAWGVRVDDAGEHASLSRLASAAYVAAGGSGDLHVSTTIPTGLGLGEEVAAACAGACAGTDVPERQAHAARQALQKALGRPLSHAVDACLSGQATLATAHYPTPALGSLAPAGAWLQLVLPTLSRYTPYRPHGQVDIRQLGRAFAQGAALVLGYLDRRPAQIVQAWHDHAAEQHVGRGVPGFFPAQKAAVAAGAWGLIPVGGGPALALIAGRRRDLAAARGAMALVHRAHQLSVTFSEPHPL